MPRPDIGPTPPGTAVMGALVAVGGTGVSVPMIGPNLTPGGWDGGGDGVLGLTWAAGAGVSVAALVGSAGVGVT